ncbi:hypothetical protein FE784_11885 [Paenibacillus hemerocallicola]|uniref:Uncharacterized protein n=1 Tax=Paenibacillus hemerocallicola TaxID=1172614 RepID=A0A5C4TAZ3_9BACL|nr:hypothetical protein [Paenibacillus hemerocallicola]TNJ66111.1 hypothetical protein FE784_11885 [Paenibacillus hemerocallicola]
MIEYDSSLLADLRQSGFNTNTRTHLFSYERFIPGQTGALPNPLSNVPGVFFTEDPLGFGQEQGQPIAYQGGRRLGRLYLAAGTGLDGIVCRRRVRIQTFAR